MGDFNARIGQLPNVITELENDNQRVYGRSLEDKSGNSERQVASSVYE